MHVLPPQHLLVGVVGIVVGDRSRIGLTRQEQVEDFAMELLQKRGQLGRRHEALFRLAGDADARPGNRVQPGLGNRLAAVAAYAIGTFLNPLERLFDRLQNLRVGLLELQLDVDFVVARRLIRQISLARVGVQRDRQRIAAAAGEDISPFAQQHLFVGAGVHRQSIF